MRRLKLISQTLTLDIGHWTLDTGHWTLDTGHWTLDTQFANKLRRSSTIMLAITALLALNLSGLHAQSNSEYNFRQQVVDDGARYSAEDDAPILSMDCLAANGDGQWTLTSTNGVGDGGSFPVGTLGALSTFSGISCGSSFAGAYLKGAKHAASSDTLPSGCQLTFNRGMALSSNHLYQPSYDTLKNFVQSCPTNYNAPGAFGLMSGDVQSGGNGSSPGCWNDFRQWLLSALAWNPHSVQYFCADVETLGGALTGIYGNGPDTTYVEVNRGTNASLAVLHWLIENPLCANVDDREEYTNSRGSQRESWINTQDTSNVPLDTTLPSMHDLGLDSVLKYASLLGVHLPHATPDILMQMTASPNPVGRASTIGFVTGREAYVKLEVFDLLGRSISGAIFEGVLTSGKHSIPISTELWPSGTYYARLTTTYGETATVKLLKQQ